MAVLLVLLLSGLPASTAEPRNNKKGKSSDEGSPTVCLIRIWKDAFKDARPIRVVVRPARKGTAIDLHLPGDRQFLDYQEFPAGNATVELSEESEPKAKIGSQQILLPDSGFFTVLLRELDGHSSIELIDDTPHSDVVAELTIRNFAPTLSALQIKVGDALTATLEPQNALLQVRGFRREMSHIDTSGSEADGTPVSWANEVDFQKFKRATLLIFPDSLGRIRPRLLIDGQLPATSDAQ